MKIKAICIVVLLAVGFGAFLLRKESQPVRHDLAKVVFEVRPPVTNESVPLAEMPLGQLVEVTVTNDQTEAALNEIGFSKTNSIKISVK